MRWLAFTIGVLATAGQVLAQEMKTPEVGRIAEDPSMAIEWLITTVFLVACLVVAFMPAKRAKLE